MLMPKNLDIFIPEQFKIKEICEIAVTKYREAIFMVQKNAKFF